MGRLDEPAPPDGWYWVRLSFSTPRGADRRWTACRVLNGAVQPHGTSAWYSPSAKWLRGAEWVPTEPPTLSDPPATAITVRRASRDDATVRRVAGEIVDVFVNLSDATAAYYRRHPEHLADIVAVVSRIMAKAIR